MKKGMEFSVGKLLGVLIAIGLIAVLLGAFGDTGFKLWGGIRDTIGEEITTVFCEPGEEVCPGTNFCVPITHLSDINQDPNADGKRFCIPGDFTNTRLEYCEAATCEIKGPCTDEEGLRGGECDVGVEQFGGNCDSDFDCGDHGKCFVYDDIVVGQIMNAYRQYYENDGAAKTGRYWESPDGRLGSFDEKGFCGCAPGTVTPTLEDKSSCSQIGGVCATNFWDCDFATHRALEFGCEEDRSFCCAPKENVEGEWCEPVADCDDGEIRCSGNNACVSEDQYCDPETYKDTRNNQCLDRTCMLTNLKCSDDEDNPEGLLDGRCRENVIPTGIRCSDTDEENEENRDRCGDGAFCYHYDEDLIDLYNSGVPPEDLTDPIQNFWSRTISGGKNVDPYTGTGFCTCEEEYTAPILNKESCRSVGGTCSHSATHCDLNTMFGVEGGCSGDPDGTICCLPKSKAGDYCEPSK